jgi:monofunctional biosynthetic peptidoglycan transglycosylase
LPAHSQTGSGGATATRTPWVRRTLAILFAFLVPIPILLILLFRFVPVPGTPQMLTWLVVGDPVHYQWVVL